MQASRVRVTGSAERTTRKPAMASACSVEAGGAEGGGKVAVARVTRASLATHVVVRSDG